jgi:hypothetical protein
LRGEAARARFSARRWRAGPLHGGVIRDSRWCVVPQRAEPANKSVARSALKFNRTAIATFAFTRATRGRRCYPSTCSKPRKPAPAAGFCRFIDGLESRFGKPD